MKVIEVYSWDIILNLIEMAKVKNTNFKYQYIDTDCI